MLKVYSKKNCIQCQHSKKMLEDLGIKYENLDVEESHQYLNEALLTGYTSLPIIVKEDGEVISGYQPDKLEEMA